MPNGSPVQYTPIAADESIDFASKSESASSDLLTSALPKGWEAALAWSKSCGVLNELLVLLDATLAWDHPNVFGNLLSHISTPICMEMLEESAQTEFSAKVLWKLASAASKKPTILSQYPRLTDKVASAKQFKGDTPTLYIIALIVERSPPGTITDREWLLTLRLWVLTHAINRAKHENIQDQHLRLVAQKIRLACAEGDNWRKLFLGLRTTALDFDALNRHLSHKSEKLISAHSLKSTEIQVLRTLIKVANRESSQDATTHVKPRYLDTAKLLADKLDKISRPEFRTIIEDDDQSPGAAEYIQASEDGESDDLAQTKTDETRSYAHQRLRSTGILLYDSEDLQHLPWSWGRPNRFEMSRLDEWTTQNLTSSDEKVSTLAGINWIASHSGRSMRRTLDFKITEEISSEWCLHPNCRTLMRLPPQRIPGWDPETDEDKAWVTPMATSNTLHLPDQVTHVFQERLKRTPDASCIGELWDASWENSPESEFRIQLKHDIPRVTPGMLGSVLPQRIFSASGDATFARLLSSHPKSALPGSCSYATWTTTQVGQALTGRDEPNTRPHLAEEAINAIGSRLDPIEELLVQAIQHASKKLDGLRHDSNLLEFHNAYVAYLAVALLAATGGRPIRDPFETIAHFDFQQLFVFINDKVSGKLRQGRLVPLPQEICEFIQSYYLPHLAKLALALQEANPVLANEISILATGKPCSSMPFLFFISPEITWTSVTESEIDRIGLFEWPLPLNLFRHRLATRLRRQFVDPEIIDSILGHGESGAATHGDYSFRIWIQDMAAASPSFDGAFRDLGFQYISSWDGALPKIAPASKSDNVDADFPETISFGSKAREHNRKVQMFSTIRDARLQLEQFLGTKSLADLGEDEIDALTRKLLFKGDGLPHPSGFIKYQYLMRRIERLWKKKGKRVRLSKRFMPRIQEESPFTEFAPGAMAIFHELHENMAAISESIRPGKLSLRDCSVIAAVLLCIENRISSKVILGDVLRARNFWLANLKGVFYFEHSSRLSTSETEAPVQRFQISSLSAVLIDRLLDSKNILAAGQPIPDFLHPLVNLLANTEIFAEIKSADELINVLGQIVAQVNAVTESGVLAGYRDGRVRSYSLKRHDWLRVALGYPVQIPPNTPKADDETDMHSPNGKLVSATALISQSSADDFAALQTGARSALNKVTELLTAYRSILPKNVTAKDRESLARKLRDIAEDKMHLTSSAIQLLVRWVQSLVHRPKGSGFININSIERYLVALSPGFEAVGYAADLLKMDDEDVTILYSEVLETSKARKIEDTLYVAQRLVDFHRWAKKKYAIEDPAWEELPETYAAAGVSPGLITEKEYQDALLLLLRLPEARLRHRLAPAVLLLLCYRFGLRGSEALGLLRSDVVILTDTIVVLVQNNRFRNLKTVTSRRQIPLVFSLSGAEKKLLEQWLAEFAAAHGSNGNAPLFFAEGTGRPLMDIGPIKYAAISVLKLVTCNPATNLHHARHTAANFVGLGVSHLELDMWIRAKARNGQSPTNIEQILLSKPLSRSRMWAVSRFLGHVRGETTCGSYLHFFGDWANSLFQPITNYDLSMRLANADYLDDLPRIASTETDLLDILTPKSEISTPLRMMKWLHLIAQGQLGTAAGAALALDPKMVEESLEFVTNIGKKLRLSQTKESQLSARNDSEERDPMEFLYRIKEPAWQRLLNCFVEAEREPNVIPSSISSIPLTDLIMMVGATRQILMWNDVHFLLMRSLLDYFTIDDGRFYLARSNTANNRILDLVSKHRFRSLSQLETAKALHEFRKKKRIAKELEVGESGGTFRSEVIIKKPAFQLDAASAGEYQVLKRCAFVLAENHDFAIRNSVEFVVVFTAFTLSVRT